DRRSPGAAEARSRASQPCVPKQSLGTRRARREAGRLRLRQVRVRVSCLQGPIQSSKENAICLASHSSRWPYWPWRRRAGRPSPLPPYLLEPGYYAGLLDRGAARLKKLEIVEMVSAIAKGSDMGPNDGWFHPSQGRYDWKWLAARHGKDADGKITAEEFAG